MFSVFVAAVVLACALLGSPVWASGKKKKKAKKGPDYDNNPYKAIMEKEPSVYRFNSKGEPVGQETKKKGKKPKKKPAAEEAPPEEAPPEEKPEAPAEGAEN